LEKKRKEGGVMTVAGARKGKFPSQKAKDVDSEKQWGD